MLRALHLLRDEGLLEFRRGRGISVSGTPQRGAMLAQVRDLVEYASRHGYSRSEVIQMIAELPADGQRRFPVAGRPRDGKDRGHDP